jgi:hypothetical protein
MDISKTNIMGQHSFLQNEKWTETYVDRNWDIITPSSITISIFPALWLEKRLLSPGTSEK